MSDDRREKTVKNMRNISPKEFEAGMPQNTPRMKREKKWGKFKELLSLLGIVSSSTSGHSHPVGGTYGAPSHEFRTRIHHDIPTRSHEDWVKEEIAKEAYMKMVDGKGDHDCGHEH